MAELKVRTRLRDLAVSTAFFGVYTIKKVHFDVRAASRAKRFDRPDVLFANDCSYWREYLHRDGRLVRDDIVLGEVIQLARERKLSVACVDIGILRRSYRLQADHLEPESPWCFLEQSVTYEALVVSMLAALAGLASWHPPHEAPLGAFHQASSAFREAFAVRMAKALLDEFRPRSVFVGAESLFIHRALAREARRRGLPVFALQHGDINYNAAYFFAAEVAAAMKRTIPTHTFVYAPKDRDKLIQESIYAPESVIVTGSPRWDVLARGRGLYDRGALQARYGLPSRKHYVLWTTKSHRVSRAEAKRIRQCIVQCAKHLGGVAIIVKEHPNAGRWRERRLRWSRLARYSNVVVVPADADTSALLHFCDLLVSYQSTTVSEAVASGKPVVLFERKEVTERSKFVLSGVAAGVSDEAELCPAIQRLLADDATLAERRAAFLDDYLFGIDGGATERVVSEVERVLAEQAEASESVDKGTKPTTQRENAE